MCLYQMLLQLFRAISLLWPRIRASSQETIQHTCTEAEGANVIIRLSAYRAVDAEECLASQHAAFAF
jgi:hypothetical protein